MLHSDGLDGHFDKPLAEELLAVVRFFAERPSEPEA
jgi:hypothetical protein